jgi:hypothetical protein
VTKLNFTQAIILRKRIEAQHNFPVVQLLGTGKEGYLLFISALLVKAEVFSYLVQVAKENKLNLIFEQWYWILIDPSS